MSKRISVFKSAAVRNAKKSSFRQKLGAVVVTNNKLVGYGFNFAHSTGKLLNDGMHAEISAINRTTARFREGSTVYVARVMKSGKLGLAKPCERCTIVLKKMGISSVCYTTGNGWVTERL